MAAIDRPARADWRSAGRDPILTALAVLLAFASFINTPLVVAGAYAAHGLNVVLWLLMVAAVAMLAPRAIVLGVAAVAAVLGALEAVEMAGGLQLAGWYVRLGLVSLFVSTLIGTVGVAVFSGGRVTYHRIMGAIVLYMAIAYWFVAPYQMIVLTDPGAFTGLPEERHGPVTIASLVYFSYVTLTSTGYGDIVPVHPLARGLANLEGVIGQLYPATLLARMVTLHLEHRPR